MWMLPSVHAEPSAYTQNYEYATRTELYAALRKLKKLIAERLKQGDTNAQKGLTKEEESLYEEFVEIFEENEFVY